MQEIDNILESNFSIIFSYICCFLENKLKKTESKFSGFLGRFIT